MKKSVFFVSKPLQYINATNIIDVHPKICVFINTMNDGKRIFESLKAESGHWAEMHFFNDRMEALKWVVKHKNGIQNIYVDTDFGFIIQQQLNKLKSDIYLYEEGIGTYLNSIRKPTFLNKIIVTINKLFGHQDYLGGYKKTKGIYVYDHKMHQEAILNVNKPRLKFERSFVEQLELFVNNEVFFPYAVKNRLEELKDQKVILYLTSWKVSEKAIEFLNEYEGFIKLIKPHPNIQSELKKFREDEILNGFIPAEMLIVFLLRICNQVIVLHQGSSVGMYLNNYKNLKIINLNEKV